MSIFDGQFGGYGGGSIGGPASGQMNLSGMQFGGGFMMNPSQAAAPVQSVPLAAQGHVVYAASPSRLRPRDRSGRGHVHRQKRY